MSNLKNGEALRVVAAQDGTYARVWWLDMDDVEQTMVLTVNPLGHWTASVAAETWLGRDPVDAALKLGRSRWLIGTGTVVGRDGSETTVQF